MIIEGIGVDVELVVSFDNPLMFYKTVQTENGAQSRLDDIIYSALREILGQNTLKDLISGKRSEVALSTSV